MFHVSPSDNSEPFREFPQSENDDAREGKDNDKFSFHLLIAIPNQTAHSVRAIAT
jgi:hypothetical protein